jgi:hypothetical protein
MLLPNIDYIKKTFWDLQAGCEAVIFPLHTLTMAIDSISEQIRAGTSTRQMFRKYYCELARLALAQLNKSGDMLDLSEFANMLMSKHIAYGDSGLIKWGHAGMFMRIGSKVDRFENLSKNPSTNNLNESIVDTLTDIVGYCVLGSAMLEQGK